MEKRNGPWVIEETEKKYEDDFLTLYIDSVLKPDNKRGTYATVQLKSGVAILALDSKEHVYLTRQFRYAVGAESTEVICGGIDEGEDPLTAAKREAKEELGLEATNWKAAGHLHLETSIIKGPVYLFTCIVERFTDPEPDDTEDIKRVKVSLQRAVQMVLHNEITHGPSCLLILKYYLQQVGNKWK